MTLGQDSRLIRSDLLHQPRPRTFSKHRRSGRTYLVGCIAVLDYPVGADNDTVNVVMLHQRAKHRVACDLST